MLLDDVAHVVDGDEDALQAEPEEVEDQPLDDRPAGDRDHRLGQVVGERAKAHALTAGHDDRPIRASHGLQELLEQVETDWTSIGIDNGHGIDSTGAHEFQRGRAAIFRRHREVAAGQHRRDGVLEIRSAQEGAAQVAVRDDAGQAPVRVHGEGDPGGTAIHRGHRITKGRVFGDEVGVKGAGHEEGSWARAGMPTTVAPGPIDSTTTAPIPTTAPAPISMWSRTRAPRPMNACS